jgi:hypothetical protein
MIMTIMIMMIRLTCILHRAQELELPTSILDLPLLVLTVHLDDDDV